MQKKILTILGDFYHSHDLALTAIEKAAEALEKATGTKIEVVDAFIDNIEKSLNESFDLVVLYKENRVNPNDEIVFNWMTSEIEEKVTEFVSKGGSWFAWHSGLVFYDKNDAYVDMVKGYFLNHPTERNVKYAPEANVNALGPKETFEVLDEHYFVKAMPLENSLFLTAESDEGKCEAGWAHQYGQGRVCALTPTHGEGMENQEMLDLLTQCLKWCLKL